MPWQIGVVGDTGAGKSSLLNALVHEDCVLETSGWRACTAVCTELSYLHEGEGYVGEVRLKSAVIFLQYAVFKRG